MSIDLNSDLGEGFGAYAPFPDLQLLDLVSSANVACGFHAGDPLVMDRTVAAAVARGVRVGAHISYPDLVGFGRRAMELTKDQLITDTLYQLGALSGVCRRHGIAISHVKPHGALYNRLCEDPQMCAWLVEAVGSFDDALPIVLRAGSPGLAAVAATGCRAVGEAFCERGYNSDGSLAARGSRGALISDPQQAAERAVAMAHGRPVESVQGTSLLIRADTICIHSDSPGAVEVAIQVAEALESAGVSIVSPA